MLHFLHRPCVAFGPPRRSLSVITASRRIMGSPFSNHEQQLASGTGVKGAAANAAGAAAAMVAPATNVGSTVYGRPPRRHLKTHASGGGAGGARHAGATTKAPPASKAAAAKVPEEHDGPWLIVGLGEHCTRMPGFQCKACITSAGLLRYPASMAHAA